MNRVPRLAVIVVIFCLGCSTQTPPAGQSSTTSTSGTSVEDQKHYEPCHPGCFPAGTLVATPPGPRSIETLQAGEIVTLIGPDGEAVAGPVISVFRAKNRLVEIRTETGTVRTTAIQPLCLSTGGFRRAGDLKREDTIWRWSEGRREATRVVDVVPTGEVAPVFNLVVGESAVFVAGGLLARGKPPATATVAGARR